MGLGLARVRVGLSARAAAPRRGPNPNPNRDAAEGERLDPVDQVLVERVAALEAGEPARVLAQPRVHLLQRPFVQHALR